MAEMNEPRMHHATTASAVLVEPMYKQANHPTIAIERRRKAWFGLRREWVTKTARPTATWMINAPRIGIA